MHTTCAARRRGSTKHIFKASRLNVRRTEPPRGMFALSPQPSANALWNLKFRHTTGDSMDTDTLGGNKTQADVRIMCKNGSGRGGQWFCSDKSLETELCVWVVCMKNMDVHDYHRGNTAGLWARWSSECVHTALRRTHLVPCTAVLILQDRWHHNWLNHVWSGQWAAEVETFGWFRKHGGVCKAGPGGGVQKLQIPGFLLHGYSKTKLWNKESNNNSCSQLKLHLCCFQKG